jgi:fatty-acyl-CoA synthase
MVPTMMIRMLKLEERVRAAHDLSSLGVLIHAAAPCPPEVKQRMIEWLGPVVHEFYSSTENYLFTAITSEESLERPGSVGRPLVGVPHVCDADGRELPVGEVGVLWSEGGHDFSYRNDPAKTADSYDSRGWTTVGDLARLDEDGYLYLADRRSDLILRGGVNVYPQEAENVLSVHPSVADVAVFGIPDAVLGERVAARVQLAGGLSGSDRLADELLEYCAHRLARDKCPETLEFAAELPRTPTGKLLRRALRDSYTAAGATLPDRGA